MTPVLLKRRSERAFESLYETHVRDVYHYALAVTGNRSDAEDVTQTTFMNAYRAMERGERPVKPKNWLISITHNVCRQRFRQAARRPTEVAYEEDVAEALVPSVDSPTAADIQRALGHLALNQREALVMRELEGRSYAEIAELLGLTVAAVETLLFRARRALREQLEGSLTCSEAEAALSRQLDGRLSREEAGSLRAHLRECETCRHLARTQRAQRKGFQALAAVPLPSSLASWIGGGAAATAGAGAGAGAGMTGLGFGLAAKAAAVTAAVAVAGGGGYTLVKHETAPSRHTTRPAAAAVAASGAAAKAPAKAPVKASVKPPAKASVKAKASGAAKSAHSKHAKPTTSGIPASSKGHVAHGSASQAGGVSSAHAAGESHSGNTSVAHGQAAKKTPAQAPVSHPGATVGTKKKSANKTTTKKKKTTAKQHATTAAHGKSSHQSSTTACKAPHGAAATTPGGSASTVTRSSSCPQPAPGGGGGRGKAGSP
jgi:RNA polymerase sigma factor (sigma-70 family)